jgi:hypothetical protein
MQGEVRTIYTCRVEGEKVELRVARTGQAQRWEHDRKDRGGKDQGFERVDKSAETTSVLRYRRRRLREWQPWPYARFRNPRESVIR